MTNLTDGRRSTTMDGMSYGEHEVDEREQRLPKWAQTELVELRRSLRRAQEAAETARLATDPDESDAVLEGRPGLRDTIGLGKGATVTFRLFTDDVSVRVTREGFLDVMSDRHTLLVEARATNHLYLHTKER